MDKLFNPASVALIGAAHEEYKVGYQILKNLINFKKVYLVNPNTKPLLGRKVYPSIKAIKDQIDLAVVVVPAQTVPQVLEECGQKKIKYVIVISAGFKESGPIGQKLEKKILSLAKKYHFRLLGPNCLGLINTQNHLNTTFAPAIPSPGPIALITQSGALCAAVLDLAKRENLSFSKIISLGNQADLNEADFLEFLAQDKQTKVILIYLEGLNDGRKFFQLAKKVSRIKPIIILKAGLSQSGKKTVAFHTGSLAGSALAYQAAFEQAGLISVASLEELLSFGKVFSAQPLPKDNRIAIITNAGGFGVLAADACSQENLDLLEFNAPPSSSSNLNLPLNKIHNPLDLLGDASSDSYQKALEFVLKNEKVSLVLVILTPQAVTEIKKTAEAIIKIKPLSKDKLLFTSFIGGERVKEGIALLEAANLPNFSEPLKAVKCFSALNRYQGYLSHQETYSQFKVNLSQAKKIIENKTLLSLEEVKQLLALYQIPYASSVFIKNEKGLLPLKEKLTSSLTYPLVLKAHSSSLLHKTDFGGIITNIKDEKELLAAFQKIKAALNQKHIAPSGFEIQEMKAGFELIIGSAFDPQFGPLLMFGLGGIYTEVLKDHSFSLPPLSEEKADLMIKTIKSYPLLKGIRGQKPVNISKIKALLLKVSQLVKDLPIKNLDFNPLIINEEGIWVVDGKIEVTR